MRGVVLRQLLYHSIMSNLSFQLVLKLCYFVSLLLMSILIGERARGGAGFIGGEVYGFCIDGSGG